MDTNAFIVKCPHCGNKKKVGFSVKSWPSKEYVFWSDSRIESEHWRDPAYTQQCPKCGRFFTLPPRNTLKCKEDEWYDTGRLPYHTLKVAVRELAGDDVAEARARLEAWWAFNAICKDYESAPEEELDFNKANMQWLVGFYTPRETRFSHLLFELNRLLGNRETCEKMIESLTFEEFVRQRKQYYKENKMQDFVTDDAELMKHRYENEMKELRFAMSQPLRPFEKSVF